MERDIIRISAWPITSRHVCLPTSYVVSSTRVSKPLSAGLPLRLLDFCDPSQHAVPSSKTSAHSLSLLDKLPVLLRYLAYPLHSSHSRQGSSKLCRFSARRSYVSSMHSQIFHIHACTRTFVLTSACPRDSKMEPFSLRSPLYVV